ncbi:MULTISPECIES: lmo0937 family membrane protein [Clostridium]|uniref:Lmo0937 family membrane protein n=2 Tax=Clostridium TaxID=1485 RepID=A0A151APN4_9CLOT|nr:MULTISPECIES: lmo0937 family membrane protein [Clostridium]KYH29530.1 hypothetical protein CLCOL_07610 [Clostridium colicanis DSM 13634]MBE6043850.1 lmo0937 family membrane protein [Clostridium thermopalmarium]PRR72854.1 hypothetical protein CPAL_14310 [Clostridium thermopalmarium DSM 5974]PVZ21099.1 hypothetical protein LX19_02329 [Clostridium thermopalmarium DSM 5974]
MKLLRWIGGIVVFFWLLGLIFRIGGRIIHLLLIIAAIVFIFDAITGRKTTRNGEKDRS